VLSVSRTLGLQQLGQRGDQRRPGDQQSGNPLDEVAFCSFDARAQLIAVDQISSLVASRKTTAIASACEVGKPAASSFLANFRVS
jgi:hypothetical protein